MGGGSHVIELQHEAEILIRYGFTVTRRVDETDGVPIHLISATLGGVAITASHIAASHRRHNYGPSIYSLFAGTIENHYGDIAAALRRVLDDDREAYLPYNHTAAVSVHRTVRHDLNGFGYSVAVWCNGVFHEHTDPEAASMAQQCYAGELPGGVLWDWLCDYRGAA